MYVLCSLTVLVLHSLYKSWRGGQPGRSGGTQVSWAGVQVHVSAPCLIVGLTQDQQPWDSIAVRGRESTSEATFGPFG